MDTNFEMPPVKKTEKYSRADKRIIRSLIGTFASIFAVVCVFSAQTFAFFTSHSSSNQNQVVAGAIDVNLVEIDENGSFEWTFEPVEIMPASVIPYGNVGVENAGNIPVYVRIKVEKTILYTEHEISPDWEDLISCNVAAKNAELPAEEQDLWIYHEGYYYYTRALTPGEQTPSLFDKVLFAPIMGNEFENSSIQFRLICQSVQSGGNSPDPTTAWGWPADTGASD